MCKSKQTVHTKVCATFSLPSLYLPVPALSLFSVSLSLNILVLMSPLLMITQCNISILSPSPCLPLSNTHTHMLTHQESGYKSASAVSFCAFCCECVFSGRLGESDCLASLQQTALFFRLDTIHVHTSWRTDTHTQGRCVSAVKMITANKQSALNAKVLPKRMFRTRKTLQVT